MSTRRKLFVSLLLCGGLGLGLLWWFYEQPSSSIEGSLDHKAVVIGLDGADWELLELLIEEGAVPNLARLKDRGASAMLRSAQPMLSPLLWTIAATGKKPEEHGILDFLAIDPATGKKVPVSSRSRRVKALWNIFSDQGLTSGVVGWWATWPSEPIRGAIVSDRLAYSLFRFEGDAWSDEGKTHPPELLDELEPLLVEARDITHDQIRRFLDVSPEEFERAWRDVESAPERRYKNPIVHLCAILASAITYQRAALHLLDSGQPDLLLFYFEGIDTVGHLFQRYAPPRMADVREQDVARYGNAVRAFYRFQDELLGPILERVEPDSTVLVFSDHGFKSGSDRPEIRSDDFAESAALWHRPYGVLLMAGEGIEPRLLDTVSIYDIAPTVLRAAGLPKADDMSGRAIQESFDGSGSPRESVATYETSSGTVADSETLEPSDADLIKEKLKSLGYLSTETGTRYVNLGASYLGSGEWERAEQAFERALRKSPRLTEALTGLSRAHIAQKHYDEALEVSLKLIEAADVPPKIYLQTAELYMKEGLLAEAETFISQAMKVEGPWAELLTASGELAQMKGQRVEAEARFREALELDPAFALAADKLLAILLKRQAIEDARDVIRHGLEASPRSAYFLDKKGLVELQAGNLTAAEEAIREALRVHPDSASSRANLGMCFALQGRLAEAEETLRAAVKNDPDNIEAWTNLGSVVAKKGTPREAIPMFEKALSLGSPTPQLLNSLGLAYLDTGQHGAALGAFRKSLTLDPDQPAIAGIVKELRSEGSP